MRHQTKLKYIVGCLLLLSLYSCNHADENKVEQNKKDSLALVNQKDTIPAWQDSLANEAEGIVGIYAVPEMLALCKLDSASMQGVSKKVGENFALLEKDLRETDSEIDGAQGIIYYNNNPKNFKFECFLLIKKIPAKKPKQSQVVVLEAAKMLIYNYYGPYEGTYQAYEEIKKYCTENKLEQVDQMRELYPTSQANEQDPKKWLTRIMVPVVKKK